MLSASGPDAVCKIRRTRVHFALLLLCFVLVVACVIVGVRAASMRRHARAQSILVNAGVMFWDGFEDPIGPNWLYMRTLGEIPADGSFSPWFRSTFCVEGSRRCVIKQTSLSPDELAALGDLVNLQYVGVVNCPKIGSLLAQLTKLKGLKWLGISSCKLSDDDIARIGALKHLPTLTLENTGISAAQLQRLRSMLPECGIVDEDAGAR